MRRYDLLDKLDVININIMLLVCPHGFSWAQKVWYF